MRKPMSSSPVPLQSQDRSLKVFGGECREYSVQTCVLVSTVPYHANTAYTSNSNDRDRHDASISRENRQDGRERPQAMEAPSPNPDW